MRRVSWISTPSFKDSFGGRIARNHGLIESVFLGIPIPQIFVAQRPDGIWDVVDGLQRLSTIYQFAGVLKDENGKILPALTLERTQYLPSLEGKRWDDESHPDQSLTTAQRLLIKRAKIDVSIILKESDEAAKYELFQRLNTGGSMLSDQEVRNSILVMLNQDFYRWLKQLSEDPNFISCIALSERALAEQYDMELVLRFIVFRAMPQGSFAKLGDLGEFLTEKAMELARNKSFDFKAEEDAFRATFAALNDKLESESFRRYEQTRDRFVGGFSVSAYEVVALGVGYNFKKLHAIANGIVQEVKSMWSDPEFLENSGSGIRAAGRIPKVIPYGRTLFAQ
jgi:hypothetical protein